MDFLSNLMAEKVRLEGQLQAINLLLNQYQNAGIQSEQPAGNSGQLPGNGGDQAVRTFGSNPATPAQSQQREGTQKTETGGVVETKFIRVDKAVKES